MVYMQIVVFKGCSVEEMLKRIMLKGIFKRVITLKFKASMCIVHLYMRVSCKS